MKKPKDTDTKPSDMFINALSGYGVGSPDKECEWCGREHLCVDSRDMNDWNKDDPDGETWAECCERRYKEDPDNIVLHYGYDSVSAHEMNGIMFVIDCPCNGLYRYEQFIWNHKDTIRNYLKDRIDFEFRIAQEQLTINKLKGIL